MWPIGIADFEKVTGLSNAPQPLTFMKFLKIFIGLMGVLFPLRWFDKFLFNKTIN
jgi:hypothetical protein